MSYRFKRLEIAFNTNINYIREKKAPKTEVAIIEEPRMEELRIKFETRIIEDPDDEDEDFDHFLSGMYILAGGKKMMSSDEALLEVEQKTLVVISEKSKGTSIACLTYGELSFYFFSIH